MIRENGYGKGRYSAALFAGGGRNEISETSFVDIGDFWGAVPCLGLVYFFIGQRFPATFGALSFGYTVILVSNLASLFLASLCAIALGVLLVDIADSPIIRVRKWLEFKDGWLNSGKILPVALEITAILWFVTSAINIGSSFYAELRDSNFTILLSTVTRLVVMGCPAFAIALLLRKRLAKSFE